MLEDLQHAQIFVTLWDGYAHQILEFQRINQEEKNVVVAVQFRKYWFWGGYLYVSNLYNVTRVFINSDIQEIVNFKKRSLSAERSSSLSGLSSSVIKSPSEEYLTDFEFSTIGGLNGISEVSTKTILNDKQDESEGIDEVVVLECNTDACNTKVSSSFPRIRVPIHVQECTVIVTLALFEREVVKLLKVSANQLLDKNIEMN
ncbi:putative nucleic acid-binding protein [Helianthus annuus]|nr:putative nucleic acid-binding protein [Helianthus annuus]